MMFYWIFGVWSVVVNNFFVILSIHKKINA